MTLSEYLTRMHEFLDGLMKSSQETGIGVALGVKGPANEPIHHWKTRPGRGSEPSIYRAGELLYTCHSGRLIVSKRLPQSSGQPAGYDHAFYDEGRGINMAV